MMVIQDGMQNALIHHTPEQDLPFFLRSSNSMMVIQDGMQNALIHNTPEQELPAFEVIQIA